MRTSTLSIAVASVLAGLGAGAPQVALGQQASGGALEEIVVTARKRAENLQQVPLAITAVTAAEIESKGIEDIREVAYYTPGLNFDTLIGSFLATPTIRGIAQTDVFSEDNNVPMFIDGVYLSGKQLADVGILDVARVEVVKGPQSALYGRNSFSGAINYVTKKPGPEFEGKGTATFGNREKLKASLSLSGPLSDTIYGRIGVLYDEFGGSYENTRTGGDIGGHQYKSVSGALRFKPSEGNDLNLSVFYTDDHIDSPASKIIPNNCGGNPAAPSTHTYYCGELLQFDSFGYDSRSYGENRQAWRVTAVWDYDLTDGVSLHVLGGVNHLEHDARVDNDRDAAGSVYAYTTNPAPSTTPTGTFTANSFQGSNIDDRDDQSLELRLQSTDSGRLSWMVGAYYYDLDLDTGSNASVDISKLPAGGRVLQQVGVLPVYVNINPGLVTGNIDQRITQSNQTIRDYAGFAQLGFKISDSLRASAEIRYTDEKKTTRTDASSFSYPTSPGFVPPPGAPNVYREDKWEFWTPRVTLDWNADEGLLVYASAAKGAKAGGFNANFPTSQPQESTYGPEYNWTYELGMKSTWMDNRVLLNLALFYINWTDMQIRSPSNDPTFIFNVTRNLGEITAKGGEIELRAQLTDHLGFNAMYAYTDPEFGDDVYDLGISYCGGTVAGSTPVCTFVPGKGAALGGKMPQRISKHAVTTGVDYHLPLGDSGWNLNAGLDYIYRSTQYNETVNLSETGVRELVNMRIGINNGALDITAWADNMFNNATPLSGFRQNRFNSTQFLFNTQAPQLRTYGLTATYKF